MSGLNSVDRIIPLKWGKYYQVKSYKYLQIQANLARRRLNPSPKKDFSLYSFGLSPLSKEHVRHSSVTGGSTTTLLMQYKTTMTNFKGPRAQFIYHAKGLSYWEASRLYQYVLFRSSKVKKANTVISHSKNIVSNFFMRYQDQGYETATSTYDDKRINDLEQLMGIIIQRYRMNGDKKLTTSWVLHSLQTVTGKHLFNIPAYFIEDYFSSYPSLHDEVKLYISNLTKRLHLFPGKQFVKTLVLLSFFPLFLTHTIVSSVIDLITSKVYELPALYQVFLLLSTHKMVFELSAESYIVLRGLHLSVQYNIGSIAKLLSANKCLMLGRFKMNLSNSFLISLMLDHYSIISGNIIELTHNHLSINTLISGICDISCRYSAQVSERLHAISNRQDWHPFLYFYFTVHISYLNKLISDYQLMSPSIQEGNVGVVKFSQFLLVSIINYSTFITIPTLCSGVRQMQVSPNVTLEMFRLWKGVNFVVQHYFIVLSFCVHKEYSDFIKDQVYINFLSSITQVIDFIKLIENQILTQQLNQPSNQQVNHTVNHTVNNTVNREVYNNELYEIKPYNTYKSMYEHVLYPIYKYLQYVESKETTKEFDI